VIMRSHDQQVVLEGEACARARETRGLGTAGKAGTAHCSPGQFGMSTTTANLYLRFTVPVFETCPRSYRHVPETSIALQAV
jgi:hypothetical protein